jgi:putative addiction module component (TIGR02574 family)
MMSEQAERIFEQALLLPSLERADLAERLLESLAPETDPRIDALWAAEAESRIDAYRRGELLAIPAEEVFDEIDAEAD